MEYSIEEMKHDVDYLLDALDESTSKDDIVWLENCEVQLLKAYIEYLENKLK